ncbi:MAG: hypothetical protein AVDCRST_MAG37-103, partial [uncultured Rubrobacteraceae bacterium]
EDDRRGYRRVPRRRGAVRARPRDRALHARPYSGVRRRCARRGRV